MKQDISDVSTRLILVTEYGYSEEMKVSEKELLEFLSAYKKRFAKQRWAKDNYTYIRQVNGWITTYHFDNGIVLLFRHGHYEMCLDKKPHFILLLKRMRSYSTQWETL